MRNGQFLPGFDFKKLSGLAQVIRFLCKCGLCMCKNVFLDNFEFLRDVWNVEVLLIPWYTHPGLKNYLFTKAQARHMLFL